MYFSVVGFLSTGGVDLIPCHRYSIYFRFVVLALLFVLAPTDNASAGLFFLELLCFRRDPEGAGQVDEIKTPRSLQQPACG